jgi:hypothetical protein
LTDKAVTVEDLTKVYSRIKAVDWSAGTERGWKNNNDTNAFNPYQAHRRENQRLWY